MLKYSIIKKLREISLLFSKKKFPSKNKELTVHLWPALLRTAAPVAAVDPAACSGCCCSEAEI